MKNVLSPFAPENYMVSRDGFGRPAPRQPACSPLRLNLVLSHRIPTDLCGGVHLLIPPFAIGSVPSLSGHAVAYGWRSLPRVRRHRASSPQGSSSNGCCLCIASRPQGSSGNGCCLCIASSPQGSSGNGCCLCIPMDQLMCASLLPRPLLV